MCNSISKKKRPQQGLWIFFFFKYLNWQPEKSVISCKTETRFSMGLEQLCTDPSSTSKYWPKKEPACTGTESNGDLSCKVWTPAESLLNPPLVTQTREHYKQICKWMSWHVFLLIKVFFLFFKSNKSTLYGCMERSWKQQRTTTNLERFEVTIEIPFYSWVYEVK